MVVGRGRLALVWVSACPLHSSCFFTCDEGMDWPLPMPASVSFLASTWPLPLPAFASFLASPCPLPTPAPANAIFGKECGHCWIILCTSLPATLAQEVLTLGAVVGEADRVVSAADEETVTVGIIPPATTWDEWEGDPTTKGCSSLPSPGKADKPATFGLTGVENDVPGDWERKE